MLLGPPRSLARDATVTDDEWSVVRDHALFQLLDPVMSADGVLAPETLAELEGVRNVIRTLGRGDPRTRRSGRRRS